MAITALQRPEAVSLADRLSLTKAEAARAVGVSTRLLETEAAAGRLKTCKAGRKVLIRTVDLSSWLDSRMVGGAEQ